MIYLNSATPTHTPHAKLRAAHRGITEWPRSHGGHLKDKAPREISFHGRVFAARDGARRRRPTRHGGRIEKRVLRRRHLPPSGMMMCMTFDPRGTCDVHVAAQGLNAVPVADEPRPLDEIGRPDAVVPIQYRRVASWVSNKRSPAGRGGAAWRRWSATRPPRSKRPTSMELGEPRSRVSVEVNGKRSSRMR